MSSYQVRNMISMIFTLAVIVFAIYGLVCAVKKAVAKAKQKMTKEEVPFETKKNILDAVKLLFGAQVIGLLFYVTPAINENIKIILSLIITLGTLVFAFFTEEKKGINGACRALVFIGQEFFGITMLLIMVNKGIGYSVNIVFLLWTIFNFYIAKKVGKTENKAFFWITLGVFVISLLENYVNEINSTLAIIVTCVILLGIHGFSKRESIGSRICSNFCFTLLMFLVCSETLDTSEPSYIIFFITILFIVGSVIEQFLLEKLNLRALLMYIPYVVVLFVTEPEPEIIALLGLFNILVSVLLFSEESIYKKVLSALFLLIIWVNVGNKVNIDELVYTIIYLSSVIVGYAYLLTPAKAKELEEGGEEDDDNDEE